MAGTVQANVLFTAISWRDEDGHVHTASAAEDIVVELSQVEFDRLEALGAVSKATAAEEHAAKITRQNRLDETARMEAHAARLSAPLAPAGHAVISSGLTPAEEFAIELEKTTDEQIAQARQADDSGSAAEGGLDETSQALVDAGTKAQLADLAKEAEVEVAATASKSDIASALAAAGFTADDLS